MGVPGRNETSRKKRQDCDAVYSFLLKGNSTAMIINGITCITLAHGITDDPVAKHAYFGSDKVRPRCNVRRPRKWRSYCTPSQTFGR